MDFAGLSQTDFLGVSCLRFDSLIDTYDTFQLSSIDLQKQARNLFFLSGANQNSLKGLLGSCSNIVTLDLLLSGEKGSRCSLPSLNHLNNLRNLSLNILKHDDNFEKEWKTLADFAQQHKQLSYLSLQFKNGDLTKENSKNITLFFDALQDSLTTLLLSFASAEVEEQCLENFAKNISNLQKLKSLYLDEDCIIKSLKTSMPCGLEELKLNLSDSDVKLFESIFKTTRKLTKLSLEVESFDKTLNFSKLFASLAELKDLELITAEFSKKNWNNLIKALPKLKNLEILKILSQNDKDQIEQIMKDHPNLKLMALGQIDPEFIFDDGEALRIIVRKGYFYNIDNLLSRFKVGFHLLYDSRYEIFYI